MKVLERTLSKNGNEIVLLGNDDSKRVLVIGVFHGDEPQGKFLIDEYIKNSPLSLTSPTQDEFSVWTDGVSRYGVFSETPNDKRGLGRGGNLLFIPCLNPDGMVLNTRTNSNGVDLNRNFPTKNWGEDTSKAGDNPSDYYGGTSAGSEIETRFVVDVIEKYKPELIVTLHAPYKIVNYDGPAKEIAEKISTIIGYSVEASIGYPTPGSFGTYAGIERQIPTITLELDEQCPVEDLLKPVHEIFQMLESL